MNNYRAIGLLALVAVLLLCGCVRIYVASPDVFSFREPATIKTSRVINDLRTIGTALEAYSVDNNTYPVVTEKDMTVDTVSLANVEHLESHLAQYVRRVSPEDPWGHPYLYWSSGKSYVLLSLGSDGIIADPKDFADAVAAASADRVFVRTKNTDCLEDEILLSGGQFLIMPKHSASECHPKR